MTALDPTKLPRHLAIIMDGNGRWARARGMSRLEGHKAGSEMVRQITTYCRDLNLEYLTLYAFSHENWQRPKPEVEGLMRLLSFYLEGELNDLLQNDIRLNAIGNLDSLPKSIKRLLTRVMENTRNNRSMVLTLALSYGGRPEILRACRSIAADCLSGSIDPDRMDDQIFSRYLYTSDLPDPDLLIRTGGENRISNFLLWQIAYAELYFTGKAWPEFDEHELAKALLDYQNRQRRFGRTGDQVNGHEE